MSQCRRIDELALSELFKATTENPLCLRSTHSCSCVGRVPAISSSERAINVLIASSDQSIVSDAAFVFDEMYASHHARRGVAG